MTIHGIGGPGSPHRPDGPGGTKPVDKSRSSQPAGGDRVELSAEARKVSALADEAGRLPEIRREKVETLRQAMEKGTYRVDPRLVARAILEFEDGFPG
jgi:negative regulator of flagellin synthesis FlgM